MNPGCTPARIGCSHFSDKIADFMTNTGSSRTFGFEFPEKFKTLSVPADNAIRLYNDKRFAPREPNSGKQNPEESIRESNFRPLVRPFHYGQLLAKRKVLGSKIRGDFDLRQYERNKISKCFHHDYSLAGACIFINKFRKYEYLRRTGDTLLEASISSGVEYYFDGGGMGCGLTWGRLPDRDQGDQYAAEVFTQLLLGRNLALTSNLEWTRNPVSDPGEGQVWILGVQASLEF